jgi:uncharacterized protein (DUF697 family)
VNDVNVEIKAAETRAEAVDKMQEHLAAARAEPLAEIIEAIEPSEKARHADEIVQIALGWSSGAGLIPVPVLDLAAMLGVQIKMLKSIADVYELPFRREMVRPLVVALVSSGGAFALATPLASLLKLVPFVGTAFSTVATPSLAVASCYATGKAFIRHFESGGTFLNFDPAKARAYYTQQLKAAVKRHPSASPATAAA